MTSRHQHWVKLSTAIVAGACAGAGAGFLVKKQAAPSVEGKLLSVICKTDVLYCLYPAPIHLSAVHCGGNG